MAYGRCAKGSFDLLILFRIKITTRIKNARHSAVLAKFDAALFLKLAPPFPKVELLKFDGCQKGDIVKIKLNFLFFTQIWESEIIENGTENQRSWFVDRATEPPFFISAWRHHHELKQDNEDVLIIDSIQFYSHNWLLTLLFYPIIYLQFIYRIPIYKKLKNTH